MFFPSQQLRSISSQSEQQSLTRWRKLYLIYLRWESDLSTDTTTTHLIGQRLSVVSCARRTSEWILLHIAETSVTELFLHCFLRAEHGVSDDHAEALHDGKLAPPHCPVTVVDASKAE